MAERYVWVSLRAKRARNGAGRYHLDQKCSSKRNIHVPTIQRAVEIAGLTLCEYCARRRAKNDEYKRWPPDCSCGKRATGSVMTAPIMDDFKLQAIWNPMCDDCISAIDEEQEAMGVVLFPIVREVRTGAVAAREAARYFNTTGERTP